MQKKEPRLCLNCPLPERYREDIKAIFKNQQYTRIKEEPSPLKECRERRHLLKTLKLQPCPYFPENENMTIWISKVLTKKPTFIATKLLESEIPCKY